MTEEFNLSGERKRYFELFKERLKHIKIDKIVFEWLEQLEQFSMKEENLHIKLVEKLAEKKFEYWKEEFIKRLKERIDAPDSIVVFEDEIRGVGFDFVMNEINNLQEKN